MINQKKRNKKTIKQASLFYVHIEIWTFFIIFIIFNYQKNTFEFIKLIE